MDGLLINTESLYTLAINDLLTLHHGPNSSSPDPSKVSLPWSIKLKLQGLPGPEAAATFLAWSQLPYTPEEYYLSMTNNLQKLLESGKCQFMPGAPELLWWLKKNNIPVALATSSHKHMFELKTTNLQKSGGEGQEGFEVFGKHIVTGDDPRVQKGRGKPFPDIWIAALDSINSDLKARSANPETYVNIKPDECVVFEDGIPGVESAKAFGAGLVVWVPDTNAVEELGELECEKVLEGSKEAQRLISLEQFEEEKYF